MGPFGNHHQWRSDGCVSIDQGYRCACYWDFLLLISIGMPDPCLLLSLSNILVLKTKNSNLHGLDLKKICPKFRVRLLDFISTYRQKANCNCLTKCHFVVFSVITPLWKIKKSDLTNPYLAFDIWCKYFDLVPGGWIRNIPRIQTEQPLKRTGEPISKSLFYFPEQYFSTSWTLPNRGRIPDDKKIL